MPKSPRFPLLATAATKEVLESPIFPKVIDHWRELAGRIIIVIPHGVPVPQQRKIRYIQVNREIPSLGDVLTEVVNHLDVLQKYGAIVDPFTMFRWDIFKIFDIAKERHLSLSWMATAHAMKLANTDETYGVDETHLPFFCASESVWQFMARQGLPEHVPFISPAWSGWLARWASQHIHTHKYHDVTDLKAVGILEDVPQQDVSMDGLGKLTFNPPIRNYVTRANR